MARHTKPVENFTNPFLVSAGVVVFIFLVTLWGAYGYAMPLFAAFVIFLGIANFPTKADAYCPAQTDAAASKAPRP